MTNDIMQITDSSLSKISRELINKKIDGKEIYFKFTHILISDGVFPLTDTSVEIDDHIYKCPTTEVSRANNNILLVAHIDQVIKINLKEIGLYYEDDDGIHLFSIIKDVSLTINKNLSYTLILNAKIDINVVNTVVFPEIVTKGGDTPPASDFREVQRIFTYTLINLERLIRLNAIGIGQYTGGSQAAVDPAVMTDIKPAGVGYNKAQVLYRYLKELSNFYDNFIATNNYSLLDHEFTSKTINELNTNSFVNIGDVYEAENMAGGFTNTSYLKVEDTYYVPAYSEWEYEATFTTSSDVEINQTITNFAETAVVQPLLLGINNSKCYLTMGKADKMTLQREGKSYYFTRSSNSITINEDNYFTWSCNESMGLNYHTVKDPDTPSPTYSNGIISRFSPYSSVHSNKKINTLSGDSWTLTISFSTGNDTFTNSYLIGSYLIGSSSKSFELDIYNRGLKIYLSSDGTNWDIADGVIAKSDELKVNPNTKYTAIITFNGSAYTIDLINEDIGESSTLATITSSTSTLFSKYLYVGSKGYGNVTSHADYFTGSVDLNNTSFSINNNVVWDGLSNLNVILTDGYNYLSTAPEHIYDYTGYRIEDVTFVNQESGTFINQNIFPVQPYSTYSVRVKYNYNKYTIEYSQDRVDYFEVLSLTSLDTLPNPSHVFYGINFNNGNFINPFLGLINLDKTYFSFTTKDNLGNVINSETFDFLSTYEKHIELTDFFHIPKYTYSHSYSKIKNLGDYPNSSLSVFEGAIKGSIDHVDFLKEGGFSLVTKVTLNDVESKVILAKGNISQENYYFKLEQINYGADSEQNNEIVFTLYTPYEVVTMSKELTPEILRRYTDFPMTLTITCNGQLEAPEFKMYKNNELIASVAASSRLIPQSINSMYLTNRTSENYEESLEKQVVHDILCFDGELQPEDIFYITNVLATNF